SEIRRIEELEATSASQQVGWIDWRKSVNDRVKLELVPRNPSLRVERAEILYIDDKLADVYFEFYTAPGYSEPFRLARASLTVRKPATKTVQSVESEDVTVTVAAPATYLATHEVGPKRDTNLQYHYTVLDRSQANSLFGQGVADSFYVIQLSVTNIGTKKV